MGTSFTVFGQVDQTVAQQLARDPEVTPLYLRVMFAAIGWSNLIGHAEITEAGGLDQILMKKNQRTGVLSTPSRRQVNAAIERASDMNLISVASSRSCLIAPIWWQKSGGAGGRSCVHHGIKPRTYRDKRSPQESGNRDNRSPAPGQEVSRLKPLNRANAEPLYDSILTVRQDRNAPSVATRNDKRSKEQTA